MMHPTTLPIAIARLLRQHAVLYLAAVREGFMVLLPLTMLGVLTTVLLNIPSAPYQQAMTHWLGTEWQRLPLQLQAASTGILGLALAAAISIRLGILLHKTPLSQSKVMLQGWVGVVSFVALANPFSGHLAQTIGHQSLLQAIVAGLVSAELLTRIKRLLPQKSVAAGLDGSLLLKEAIASTTPLLLACTLTVLVVSGLQHFSGELLRCLGDRMQPWLASFSGAQGLDLLVVAANQILWLLGLHGGNLIEAHASAFVAPADVLFDQQRASIAFVNAFAYMGGAGATAGLVIALFCHSRERSLRRLASLSVVPAFVNVNEILVYGLPIVFSPIFAIPFVLAPLASTGIALLAQHWGWFELAGQPVSWSTPIFLSGYLLTNAWQGAFVQLLGLTASTMIYWPFVRRLDRSRRKAQSLALNNAIESLATPLNAVVNSLARTDSVGDFARALHADFEHDISTARVFQAYQPKHDTAGKLCGVEALLRWNHATHGRISPCAIINIAEETELIHRISEWSLDTACANLARWKKAGLNNIVMSVNLSPLQLEDIRLAATIQHCLVKHGLQPALLDLEITEGRSIPNTVQAHKTLHQLAELGVHLSMDDFGMGYTSLLYLQRFKMYSIKIDGSLTRDVITNPINADIIRAIVQLGQKQGVHIVAEFVDNIDQQAKLADLGCDEFQGYLYSQALEAEAMATYIQAHQ